MPPPVATWIFWRDYPSGALKNTLPDSWAFVIVSVGVLFINLISAALWVIAMWSLARCIHDKVDRQPPWLRKFYYTVVRTRVTAFKALYLIVRQFGPHQWHRHPFAWLLVVVTASLSWGTVIISIVASFELTFGTEENPGVLLDSSNHRAYFWAPNMTDSLHAARSSETNRNLTLVADSYSRACYDGQHTIPCQSFFMSQTLPFHTRILPDSCPFSQEVCINATQNAEAANIRIETPWLKVVDLGLNTKRDLQIRLAQECVPIHSSTFCVNCDTADDWLHFVFGDRGYYEFPFYLNSTSAGGYRVSSFSSFPYVSNLSDAPSIDVRLQRQDGTTTIVFLSAPGVFYTSPVTDPIFNAQTEVQVLNKTFWMADHYVTAFGCVNQVQVSNNATNKVSEWQPPETVFQDSSVFSDDESRKIALILSWAAPRLSLNANIAGRGASSIRASDSLYDLTQTRDLHNQSLVEATAWFTTSLAKLMLSILSVGMGDDSFNSTGSTNLLDIDAGKEFQNLAGFIKIKDGRYSSISCIGIIFIVLLGIVLWILAHLLTKYKSMEFQGYSQHLVNLSNQAYPTMQPQPIAFSITQQTQYGSIPTTAGSNMPTTYSSAAPVSSMPVSNFSDIRVSSGKSPNLLVTKRG